MKGRPVKAATLDLGFLVAVEESPMKGRPIKGGDAADVAAAPVGETSMKGRPAKGGGFWTYLSLEFAKAPR